MKTIKNTLSAVVVLLLLTSCASNKSPLNTNGNGYMAEGFDVTSYFDGMANIGLEAYTSMYNGAKYKFTSQANKDTFDANPAKYEPQYGGYCAYAVGTDNKKISINPESYEIRDGKLYLFYDTVFADTKKKWEEEGPEMLKKKADANWSTLKNSGK